MFIEADSHDLTIRSEFSQYWNEIEMEYELRTEAWAPSGASSDERLTSGLASFRQWATEVLGNDQSDEHN